MEFFRDGIRFVFCCLRELQDPGLPDFRQRRRSKLCELATEFLNTPETLVDRRVKREQRADNGHREGFRGRIVGLRVQKQAMPAVMRIFRLIEAAPRSFCDNEICWVVYRDTAGMG